MVQGPAERLCLGPVRRRGFLGRRLFLVRPVHRKDWRILDRRRSCCPLSSVRWFGQEALLDGEKKSLGIILTLQTKRSLIIIIQNEEPSSSASSKGFRWLG